LHNLAIYKKIDKSSSVINPYQQTYIYIIYVHIYHIYDIFASSILIIPNEEKAIKVLSSISYNRLSEYWYPMLRYPKDEEIFQQGTNFDTIFRIYQFDSILRQIVFQAIEQIEVALRTQIIYHQSHKYNSGFWYEERDAFSSVPDHLKILQKISSATQQSKQEFIKKYRREYEQYFPPSWKAFEIISFTTLYMIYKSIKESRDKNKISDYFGLNHRVLISWIDSLVYVRNICAHHSRLWNITLTITPTWPKKPRGPWVTRWENQERNQNTRDKVLKPYAALCMIQFLLLSINPYNTFTEDLKQLLSKYPQIDINVMGFPSDWEHEPLWS